MFTYVSMLFVLLMNPAVLGVEASHMQLGNGGSKHKRHSRQMGCLTQAATGHDTVLESETVPRVRTSHCLLNPMIV